MKDSSHYNHKKASMKVQLTLKYIQYHLPSSLYEYGMSIFYRYASIDWKLVHENSWICVQYFLSGRRCIDLSKDTTKVKHFTEVQMSQGEYKSW